MRFFLDSDEEEIELISGFIEAFGVAEFLKPVPVGDHTAEILAYVRPNIACYQAAASLQAEVRITSLFIDRLID